MVKFAVERTTAIGRYGVVSKWGDVEVLSLIIENGDIGRIQDTILYALHEMWPGATHDLGSNETRQVASEDRLSANAAVIASFMPIIPFRIESIRAHEKWKKGAPSFCGILVSEFRSVLVETEG